MELIEKDSNNFVHNHIGLATAFRISLWHLVSGKQGEQDRLHDRSHQGNVAGTSPENPGDYVFKKRGTGDFEANRNGRKVLPIAVAKEKLPAL